MQQISWGSLGLIGESKQKSFEDLCLFLFCRDLKISTIEAYQNQPGIETEPVEVNGVKYGFQSKFFESSFKWGQVKNSIKKGINNFPYLDEIYIYSNKDKTLQGSKKTDSEKELDKLAKQHNITLRYVTDTALLKKLSEPKNLDIAQLYFGLSDEFSFIKNSLDPEVATFTQSKDYFELPFADTDNKNITVIPDKLISIDEKVIFILGNPGSGKSITLHKLLQVYGGLEEENEKQMMDVLIKNNAIPILICMYLQ
ncbi:hypothetical protein [Halobacillus karajensis]|uniref:hypothetical protein n=1 Tax=Halobacillus karajensis TaxID=195088 RepID=UPI00045CAA32|nr:hypothetical protein [Halobacillus karajensis]CDQ21224.1 hypothetical protein BN982_03590 [Halobacillus karajensis]